MNLSLARLSLLIDRGMPNFWHMGVSPLYKIFCTFLTFDLYVGGGGILGEYYSKFSFCLFRFSRSYTGIGFQKNYIKNKCTN